MATEDEGGKYFTHGRDSSAQNNTASVQQALLAVVNQMLRGGRLTPAEHALLKELVRVENEYVLAAFELFESDQDIEELQDTLLRCAKLESRKRSLEAQEAQLDERYRRSLQSKYDAAESADETEEGEELRGGENETDEQDFEDTGGKFALEDIGLSSILESLDVVNIWESTVPGKFVKTVFIAVIRKQLDIYQAKALCDLYHANYDLVRAAWEVYTVQNDVTDLLDTLKRVVKDLTLDEDDDEEGLASSDEESDSPAANSAPVATAASSSPQGSAQSALDRKQEALAAVASAKRDLLKHSLEMMVKQGIVGGDAASKLFSRYQDGDMLAEAAIDAYATDRNVAEFLDTLQILANHTPDELSEMMKDVAEEAADIATSASPTAANTRANSHIAPADVLHPPIPPETSSVPNTVAMAQLQLKGIVTELSRNQMISAEVHAVLNRLVSEPDQRLIVAFQRYLVTQEGAKLIDTLLQVAAAEITLDRKIAEATEPDEQEEESEQEDKAPEDGKESLLNASDQKTVIDILARYFFTHYTSNLTSGTH